MAKIITDNQHYSAIAEAIRTKNETDTLYKPSEMASAILEIQGGGADLNFEVVGNPKPDNPKENTIWIDTNTAITGWSIGSSEPSETTNGMVWIETNLSGSIVFDILKEDALTDNSILIYPKAAYQYTGNSWENMPVMIYQGGEWKILISYLYNAGDVFSAITGGWTSTDYVYYYSKAQCQFYEDSMYIFQTTSVACGGVGTANLIDLSGYKTLMIDILPNADVFVFITDNKNADLSTYYTQKATINAGTRRIFQIPLSVESGYICFITSATTGSSIYSVWLE